MNLAEEWIKYVLEMNFDEGVNHKLLRSNRGFCSYNIGEDNIINSRNIMIVSLDYDIFIG